jgi:peptidoglycan/xylan/chitin deacetylase (PgdA/CDA1 family)
VKPRVLLHSITGPRGSALERWIEHTSAPYGPLTPLIGPFPRPIVRLSGSGDLVRETAHGLPDGAATCEAQAVRLRRKGAELAWGPSDVVPDTAAFLRLCRDRGAASVDLVRADASLLPELQLGAFFHAYWLRRVFRRVACRFGSMETLGRAGLVGLAADAAFWRGVRTTATNREWDRFARSSYVVFYYHRIGERGEPGEERLDVHPRRFELHLRWLRLLRFRPLAPEELIRFHNDPHATLPKRSFVLTADDAFRDAVAELRQHAHLRPLVFVNTACAGGGAFWAYDEPVATWEELREFEAAGGRVASHARGHPRLTELEQKVLEEELEGSLGDLEIRLSHAPPLLAYPHGLYDEGVRSASAAAGYRAAFTTQPGKNGAGTDTYCLRRLGLKDWDGSAAMLWKLMTGELLPWVWERGRIRRLARQGRIPPQP